MSSIKEEREVEKWLYGVLPYNEILPDYPHIIQNMNNKILSTFKFTLIGNEMRDDIIRDRNDSFIELFSYFDKRFSFTFDYSKETGAIIRQESNNDEIGLGGVKKVCEKKRDFLENKTIIFDTTLYLTVCFSYGDKRLLTKEIISEFQNALEKVIALKNRIGVQGELLKEDELFTYLYSSLSNDFKITPKLSQGCDIRKSITRCVDVYPSAYPLYINEKYVNVLSLRDLPRKTDEIIFTPFLSLPFPIRLIIKFNPYNKKETQDHLYKKKREFKSSLFSVSALLGAATRGGDVDSDEVDYSSLSGKEECDTALNYTENENINGGLYYAFIIIGDKDNKRLEDKIKMTLNCTDGKVMLKREERNNSFAYFTAVINGGSKAFNHNEYFLITDNACDTLIKSGNSSYIEKSPHLENITHSSLPFAITVREDNSIFHFSPFGNSEVGHTFISGPTGSGKSILLSYLSNEWLKYKNTKVIYIDFGLSCLNLVQSNDGKLFYPTVDKTTFSPFHNARDNVDNVIAFVESIALSNSLKLSPRDRLEIRNVCNEINYGEEDLETFYALLKNKLKKGSEDSELVDTLHQYISTLGNGIFNSRRDDFKSYSRVIGIETEKLLSGKSNALVYPTLTFLLNKIEEYFDPFTPCMVIIDEAWKFLKDDFFCSFIEKWLRTLRKKNAFVVIATQEIEDLKDSDIASVILDSCTSRIFLSNKRATEPRQYASLTRDENGKGLGLESHLPYIISELPRFNALILQQGKCECVDFLTTPLLDDLKTSDEMKQKVVASLSQNV